MKKNETLLRYKNVSKKLILLFSAAVGIGIIVVFLLNQKIERLIERNIDLSKIINVSGRQRMLSQNITKSVILSHKYDLYSTEELPLLLEQFNESSVFLNNVNLRLSIDNQRKNELIDLLYAIENHQGQIVEFAQKSMINESLYTQRDIQMLLEAESKFLPLMDQITNLYEEISSELYLQVSNNIKASNIIIIGLVLLFSGTVLVVTLGIIRKFSRQLYQVMVARETANDRLTTALADQESKVKELEVVTNYLKTARKEAIKNGNIKSQFLSTMSHEIRTPMNAIIGATNLIELENPKIKDDQRFKLLKMSSNNLLSLINDILDYQKISSGNLSLNSSTFELRELIENLVSIWKPLANEKDVELVARIDENLHEVFIGDATRINQVLNNIVNNAIKFTNDGMVQIKIQQQEGGVYFEVKDTGIGIPEESHKSIFEQFSQVDSSATQKVGGTGLGLAISQEIIKLMGSKICVESKEDFGSKFFFNIKLEKGESQSLEKVEVTSKSVDDKRVNILVVEDNKGNQTIATGFLNQWGFCHEIANNGQEALEMITSKNFDLVLMDLRMPILNGFDASASIRRKEDEYFKNIPIIALSASTFSETKTQIYNCGMNDFLSKPFNPKDLHNKILSHLDENLRRAS